MNNEIVCSGVLFYARNTHRILLLQKAKGKHKNTWGLVGGKNNKDESVWEGLQREITEEVGSIPSIIKSIPLETFVSDDDRFSFHTYLSVIDDEFVPTLSNEHSGWAWTNIASCPRPLHQGLHRSFTNKMFKQKLETIFQVLTFF